MSNQETQMAWDRGGSERGGQQRWLIGGSGVQGKEEKYHSCPCESIYFMSLELPLYLDNFIL